jgi:hypothetical protein
VIPKKDKCCTVRDYTVIVGWHGKIVISSGREGVKVYWTIYDSIESNVTGFLNLILRNGINIASNQPYPPYCSKRGHVYYDNLPAFFVYRRENKYRPVKHMVRHTRPLEQCKSCFFKMDIWSDTPHIICVPGPLAIAFVNLCDPVDGIAKKRPGNNNILRELVPSFRPPSKDVDMNHFFFSMDGSLLHLIRNPKKTANVKEHLLSADIYTRMMS